MTGVTLHMDVAPAAGLTFTSGGPAAAFAAVPSPRRQASVDDTLPAILTLAAAILSAHQWSVERET